MPLPIATPTLPTVYDWSDTNLTFGPNAIRDEEGNGFGQSLTGKEAKDYQDYWMPGNVMTDWWNHENAFEHNEALAAYQREAAAAQAAWERESNFNSMEALKARDFEKMMSDTAMQRKVADYVRAGFSPLAALEGTVGASTPSGAAAAATGHKASAPAASLGANNFGGLLGAFMMMVATVLTKGISAVSKASASSGAAMASGTKFTKGQLHKVLVDQLGDPKDDIISAEIAKSNAKDLAEIAAEKHAQKLERLRKKAQKSMEAKWAKEAAARHAKFG